MSPTPKAKVVRGTVRPDGSGDGPVLTIGNFDGVHRGHRQLLDATRALARELSVPAAVLTFDPPPRDVLRPDAAAPRLQQLDDKLTSLSDAGIDEIYVERFTLELAAMEPAAFAEHFLAERLDVSGLVLGYDFRFGRRRAGTADDLRRLLDVPIRQVEPLLDDGPVSSSRIRAAIADGQLALARRLLGRCHEVRGEVLHGDARGRELGFPTANLRPPEIMPPYGVYAVRGRPEGSDRWVDGVANWGVRPMWKLDEPLLEVHLLDWSGDLYGHTLRVQMVQRLRGEARFDSLEQLEAAIADDVRAARVALS
jgi:riboflavin kinase/FMN adenylyltransferase